MEYAFGSHHCTVRPEDAPLEGICAICKRHLDRASFCCGCGYFVCWTHGEPEPLPPATPAGETGLANTPHAVEEHRRYAA